MSARAGRVVRGFAAALFSTAVAAVSHVAGGGASPSLVALALSFSFSVLACMLLAGREIALWRTAAGVLVSQFLFHFVFSGLSTGSGAAVGSRPVIAPAMSAGMHHPALPYLSAAHPSPGHPGWEMWLAHAVAAILTVLALRRGEQAVVALVRAAGLALRPVFALIAPVTLSPAAPAAPATADRPGVLVLLRSVLSHRGPPAACAV